ncbi:MAG: hypothetical protein KJ970_13010 [Candidatus Eisenbacteria bacterium]|uniref:Uncharacterized protein n=1 Tax=Eiseniibacteriota bacterium TaxID=2212470 RepID=A0A948S0Z3_UNCEI|nr:hypothetical protein [Candidatus Eisenbacteria bacterium]MBU1947295.1 hypothetical protein [Candidatus Eisenbacteria bacterium]MBU2691834.1 hypothetical protein [Candidatus Eisenbacteria bacterium]
MEKSASEDKLGDRLKRQIREIYSVASVKTEEYARIGKKRLDILSLSRDVAREKRSLGERVYELSQRDDTESILPDVTVKAIIGRIRKLEVEIGELEAEISKIREEARKAREEETKAGAGTLHEKGSDGVARPEEKPEASTATEDDDSQPDGV